MRSPILFLIFNRPDTTKRVFEEIRKAQPPRLYIAADGPRPDRRGGEFELCEKTRSIAQKVDWNCEVKTLFRDENLGCGKAVSQAIAWFFDNEPEGIILEDDILPHPDFFPYCDELLDRYRDDSRIGMISGACHIYQNLDRQASYGFISVPHIWGWATWKKRWEDYRYDLKDISLRTLVTGLKSYGYTSSEINFWRWIYYMMKHAKIDTWDYQWSIALLSKSRLNIFPYRSLTKNIGFASNATHTTVACKEEMKMKTFPICPLCHPESPLIDKDADRIDIKNGHRILPYYKYIGLRVVSAIKIVFGRR